MAEKENLKENSYSTILRDCALKDVRHTEQQRRA
jgi:hypothetical protein